jgi:hypothetical protein
MKNWNFVYHPFIAIIAIIYYFVLCFALTLCVSIVYQKILDKQKDTIQLNESIYMTLFNIILSIINIGILYIFIKFILDKIPFPLDNVYDFSLENLPSDYKGGELLIPLILFNYHEQLQNRIKKIINLTK